MIENLVIRMVPWETVEPVGGSTSWEIRVTLGRCFQAGDLWKGVLMGYMGGFLMETAMEACFWLGSFCLWTDSDVTTSVNSGSHHLLWAYTSTQLI